MTTKPKVTKFRIRRDIAAETAANTPDPAADTSLWNTPAQADPRAPAGGSVDTPAGDTENDSSAATQEQAAGPASSDLSDTDPLSAIAKEQLTGRQLRMARRTAQKNGISFTSDFDAVHQLRKAGIDPFQRAAVFDMDSGQPGTALAARQRDQLPEKSLQGKGALTMPGGDGPQSSQSAEIAKIQAEIAQRRRRRLALLFTRLAFFVFLPTAIVGWYYFTIATPMYATKSEIVIQQAQGQAAAGGLGGLFAGTSMATQQDSIAVQSYLTSREAMLRLDRDHGFRARFSDPAIDDIQRLPEDASNEDAFDLYVKHVKISYDPTEGIIRMEVIAPDPETSVEFAEALIGYAEEEVDQLTSRLRDDQMAGARTSYEEAERLRAEALATLLEIQQDFQQIDVASETAAQMGQISSLESERQRLTLILQSRLNAERPSQLQVEALRAQISNIEDLIAQLRNEMTSAGDSTDTSLAARNTELRTAEENYGFRTLLVQQALTQMETAQIEANRQVRYLSLSVNPTAPDEPAYPRAFENTLLALLIFSGIYLVISMTASVLREQVSS